MPIPKINLPIYSAPNINPDILDKYFRVNRLIIIGNGFDLAHGLKSSFKDFINNYCFESLHQLIELTRYEDRLISINSDLQFSNSQFERSNLNIENAFGKFLVLINHSEIKLKFKSKFLESIINDVEKKNWVDIEMQYFDFLKRALNDNETISALNDDFNYIKSAFILFLTKQIEAQKIEISEKLRSQFIGRILPIETKPNTIIESKTPERICFLNFNYTEIVEQYSKIVPSSLYIPIHGKISGNGITEQEPVFGFGDDMDSDYQKFENHKNEEIFTNIKSFKYLQFQNYRNLLEFIESEPYQVYIFGHSCGLSDRTLLNTIFENENCISIKPYYFENNGTDDYIQKSYSIARHFKSKADLRIKVVNKTYCEPMVQPLNS
jgi:hypothetical protein